MKTYAATILSQVCRGDSQSTYGGLPRKFLTTFWAIERSISVVLQDTLMECFHQAALATFNRQRRQLAMWAVCKCTKYISAEAWAHLWRTCTAGFGSWCRILSLSYQGASWTVWPC